MFRVISLNLNGYESKHGAWTERRQLICEVLREKDPDVLALQAVKQGREQQGGIDQATQLAACMRDVSSMHFRPSSMQTTGGLEGSALISTLMDSEFNGTVLHQSPDSEDKTLRLALRAAYQTKNETIVVYNCHFSWVKEENIRNVQEALVKINEDISSYALVVGDFNTSPDSPGIELFKRHGWIDGWRIMHGEEPGLTFESNSPEMRIDYAFLSPALAKHILGVEVISREDSEKTVRMSDHLGLLIDIDIL